MNICLIAKGFPPEVGGVEEYSNAIFYKLKELFNNRFRAYVFTNEHHADLVSIKKSRYEIINFLKLFLLIFSDKNRSTIFWATTWKVALPLYFLNRRYIVTAHGNEFLRSEFLLNKLMKLVYKKADKIICVSNFTRERLIQKFYQLRDRNVIVAYNGISVKYKDVISNNSNDIETIIFYTVCRLEKKKNIHNAIIAFNQLLNQHNINAIFKIAGIGTEEESLKTLVQELSIGENVEFLGYVNDEDLLLLHSSSDIFLHPNIELDNSSNVEGFGLVIADAAACGNIPIVGDNGGPVEIVNALEFGYIVNGNDINDILKAMLSSLKNGFSNSDRIQRKEKALRCFSWDSHVLEVLNDVIVV